MVPTRCIKTHQHELKNSIVEQGFSSRFKILVLYEKISGKVAAKHTNCTHQSRTIELELVNCMFIEPRNRFHRNRFCHPMYRPARLHRLAKSISWNRFLSSFTNWGSEVSWEVQVLSIQGLWRLTDEKTQGTWRQISIACAPSCCKQLLSTF